MIFELATFNIIYLTIKYNTPKIRIIRLNLNKSLTIFQINCKINIPRINSNITGMNFQIIKIAIKINKIDICSGF
jgi:hypothetical protein